MLARLSAFVIWALVAATAVFWGLRLLVRAPAAPPYAVAVGDAAAVRGDLTRLLGTAPVAPVVAAAAPEAASRFRLLGIVAPQNPPLSGAGPTHGVALIAVDGKMPKAYAVGAQLDGDLVLKSVSLRSASIASSQGGAPPITLELPRPAAAATGSLPVGSMGGMPVGSTPPAIVPQYVPVPIQPPPVPMSPTQKLPQQAPRPDTGAQTE